MGPTTLLTWGLLSAFASQAQDLPSTDAVSRLPDYNIKQELGPRLSPNAQILLPGDPGFGPANTRWSAGVNPGFRAVVIPGIENDVAETVKFASNRPNPIPFLAVNRGHGTAASISNVKNGINILIRSLASIEVAPDRQSGILGGGVRPEEVVAALAAQKKVTVTGSCTCVGGLGAALGGGFGRYQGYFGLITDQFLSMNVVLANGSQVVVSNSSNPDLFWGMRGAGHNFGILTSFQFKIYDQPTVDWYFQTLTFTGDKLEAFFTELNKLNNNGRQDIRMVTYTLFTFDPSISPTIPIIRAIFEFAGPQSVASPFITPFLALNPLSSNSTTVPFTLAGTASQSGINDFVCQDNLNLTWKLFPIGLPYHNLTATRMVWNLLVEATRVEPGLLPYSVVQFEGYSMIGARRTQGTETAYAHRGDNVLVSFDTVYVNNNNGSSLPPDRISAAALTYGARARSILHAGSPAGYPLNTYVNYVSSGQETVEMIYGYEGWRLRRLRRLKREWDPGNAFGFYNPLV